jgi:hypothetical protein
MLTLAPHPTTLVDLPQSTTFRMEWGVLPGTGTPFGDMADTLFANLDAEGTVPDVFPARPSPWATQIAHISPLAFFQPVQIKDNLFRARTSTTSRTRPVVGAAPTQVQHPQARLLVALRVGANRYKPLPWALSWEGAGYGGLEKALVGGTLLAIAQAIESYPKVARTLDQALDGAPVLPWITGQLHKGTGGAVERLANGMGVAALRATARHLRMPIDAVRQCTIRSAPVVQRRVPWTAEAITGQATAQVRLAGGGSREGKTAEQRFTLALQALLARQPCLGDPLRWLAQDAKGERVALASFETSDLLAPRSHHLILFEERLFLSLQEDDRRPGAV